MSCLWQSSKIPGYNDGFTLPPTKIRYRCLCMAVIGIKMIKLFASTTLFQPDMIEAYIKLSLQVCYLLLYCICLILLLRLYRFLCT